MKNDLSQGYNFSGAKASELKAKLDRCKRDENYARSLFGLPPKPAQ